MKACKESRLQQAFFEWLAWKHKDLRKVSFAIPNGGRRDAVEALYLKKSGVTAGCPDVALMRPNALYAGLFIEFKIKPNKPTATQIELMENLSKSGYKCQVCYTLEEAIQCVETYLIKDDGCLMQHS